jgi:hypothetical protein
VVAEVRRQADPPHGLTFAANTTQRVGHGSRWPTLPTAWPSLRRCSSAPLLEVTCGCGWSLGDQRLSWN